jgi:hypothetical protein
MADVNVADLFRLDRDVARVVGRLESGAEAFAGARHAAAQSTYVALGELAPSGIDAPLREALREWVRALTQARIGAELDAAWAGAADEKSGRFDGDEPRLVSWREAWRGVAAARAPAEARRWIAAATDVASKLAAVARERAERRGEVARRMGAAGGLEHATLAAGARALLDATADVARETQRAAAKRTDGEAPEAVLVDAVARDAADGWPARLTARWLDDVVGALAKGLAVKPKLPDATLGGATFARALYTFGFAYRVACAASSGLPFAVARAPGALAEHVSAFLFASLAASAEFHRRALGLSRAAAASQSRALARTALLDARLHAARVLLGDPARFAPPDLFDELGASLFGAPLPRALAGAWPAARVDDPQRFAALLAALPLRDETVARHDVDWWRNPRAASELRARFSLPARVVAVAPAPDDLVPAAHRIARAFEEALA